MAHIGNSQPQRVTSLQTPFSRYVTTRVFQDKDRNKIFFGTWNPPKIFETKAPTYHVLAADEKHRPDLVAYRVYNDPNLFWAIALRNNIAMPLIDMTAGLVLTCPHIDDISAAVSSFNSAGRQL